MFSALTLPHGQKRNQLNPQRHYTYMNQMNRRPRSLEQSQQEQGAAGGQVIDLGDGVQLSAQELEQLMAIADGTDGAAKPPLELLLRLAGGNKEMIHETGKDGMELRTVLAQRVCLHPATLFAF